MNFRTELKLPASARPLGHDAAIVAMGSCFADAVGRRLEACLFPVRRNPLGPVFSPLSLARQIEMALAGDALGSTDFFRHLELWRHFEIHSSLAERDRDASVASAAARLRGLGEALRRSQAIILTLGTAWSYRHLDTGNDVGHNHRLPASAFEKRLLAPAEIEQRLGGALEQLHAANPELQVLISVSPVRHLRDGLRENNLSKAALHLAAAAIEQRLAFVEYFPAYELLIDDLRDYRFYDEDLAHPSAVAVEYIWEAFAAAHLSAAAMELCREIDSIRTALAHRPHHPDTEAHAAFQSQLAQRIQKLEQRGLDVAALRSASSP